MSRMPTSAARAARLLLTALLAAAPLPRAGAAAPAAAPGAPGAEPPAEAGECLAGAGVCPEERLERDEEALVAGARTELLQRGVRLRPRAAGAPPEGEAGSLAAVGGTETGRVNSSIDCEAYPMFCSRELNCRSNPLTEAEGEELKARLATPDGRANPRSWCYGYPLYATSVQKCIVEKDLRGYAQSMFQANTARNLLSADAAYCFAVGHCNITTITEHTTLPEAEQFCDQKFGHEAWTSVGWNEMERTMNAAFAYERGDVIMNATGRDEVRAVVRNLTMVSAMTACAMANFHCDTLYCKVNYCDKDTYRAQFGFLSWAS